MTHGYKQPVLNDWINTGVHLAGLILTIDLFRRRFKLDQQEDHKRRVAERKDARDDRLIALYARWAGAADHLLITRETLIKMEAALRNIPAGTNALELGALSAHAEVAKIRGEITGYCASIQFEEGKALSKAVGELTDRVLAWSGDQSELASIKDEGARLVDSKSASLFRNRS